MNSLAVRHREPELMDDPDLDPVLHEQALVGLRRVHWLSGTVGTLWRPIRKLAAQQSGRPLRVLDVACGGGDVAISIARRAEKANLSIDVSGCDISETALKCATQNAFKYDANVHFFPANAISEELSEDYDVVICSLFLHHLDDDDAVKLLKVMKQAARKMVLVSDLKRSRLGYVLTWCGLRLLTRSRICHVDGPLSVRAAFKPGEATNLTTKAGLDDALLTRHWPERYLITWRRR